jgi:hypothetical protein
MVGKERKVERSRDVGNYGMNCQRTVERPAAEIRKRKELYFRPGLSSLNWPRGLSRWSR